VLAVTLEEQLNAFRASAPIHSLRHDGVEWTYRATGNGTQGLLLLPGAVGSGEAFFTLTPLLIDTHRILAIAYPRVDSLARLLEGLRAILDREGLESADMVGGSFGGLIAQAFLRRFPQRTRRVALSATGRQRWNGPHRTRNGPSASAGCRSACRARCCGRSSGSPSRR